jgi:hypothetical protein
MRKIFLMSTPTPMRIKMHGADGSEPTKAELAQLRREVLQLASTPTRFPFPPGALPADLGKDP